MSGMHYRGPRRLVNHLPWLAAVAVLLCACEHPPPEPAEFRIGVITPLSGPLADSLGLSVRHAARLAEEQTNRRGGLEVGGRRHRVVVLVEDSGDRPETAVDAARQLIHRDEVSALVGPILSRNALAVAALAESTRTLMISPSATHVGLTAGRHYVFRATFSDDLQGRVLARFARRDLEAATAAVLYDVTSAYNRNLAEIFRTAFEEAGGRIVAFETYTSGANGFHDALLRIREAGPGVLFLPNYLDDVPAQVRQARRLGIDATLLGSDSWDGTVFPGIDELAGAFFADDWQAPLVDREAARAFVELYRRTFGSEPNTNAALTYDCFGLLLAAATRKGGIDGERLRAGLATTVDYPGVTGILSYRGTGDPIKDVLLFQIDGGRLVLHRRVSP